MLSHCRGIWKEGASHPPPLTPPDVRVCIGVTLLEVD